MCNFIDLPNDGKLIAIYTKFKPTCKNPPQPTNFLVLFMFNYINLRIKKINIYKCSFFSCVTLKNGQNRKQPPGLNTHKWRSTMKRNQGFTLIDRKSVV